MTKNQKSMKKIKYFDDIADRPLLTGKGEKVMLSKLIEEVIRIERHNHEILVNTILEAKKAELIRVLESLRMKKERAGFNSGTPYDDGYNDGYRQAVAELNKKISQLKKGGK